MNDQPVMPGSTPNMFPSGSASGGGSSFILVGVLGLAAVVFAILFFVFLAKYTSEVNSTNSQKAAAAKAAADKQKAADDLDNTKANESPFRSYTAPEAYGSFVINFPKNWSSTLDTEPSNTQVLLVLNPNFISRTNGTDDLVAARVQFIQQPQQSFMGQFSQGITGNTLHESNMTVSGQPAFSITGQFGDHKTVREVVVPIRDKVLVFTTESSKFSEEFNEILAQAKINP